MAISHHDTDDYYWQPTNPPYRDKRAIADRLRLMRELFLDRGEWVLSGSLDGWGDPLIPLFDLVLFVVAPTEARLQRLREREARRCGAVAIAAGGWRHREFEEFIEWASHGDGTREGRNLNRHEAWLSGVPCRILKIDGTRATRELMVHVLAAIGSRKRTCAPVIHQTSKRTAKGRDRYAQFAAVLSWDAELPGRHVAPLPQLRALFPVKRKQSSVIVVVGRQP